MANCKCMNCMGDFNDSISEICPHCGHSKNEISTDRNVLPAGTVLVSRYMLGNKIKDNSTGFGYIAWDNSNGRKVMIKEYFPKDLCTRVQGSGKIEISGSSHTKFEKGKELFLERGQNFMEKSEEFPGIAKAVDLFCENNTAYIVLEFIEGVSVGEVIANQNMPWSSFKDIIRPVIRTVEKLHKLKLTDQCIDPDNIVVTSDRRVVLTDFDCLNGNKVISSRSINKDHDNYAAIELYRSGSRLTPACDVYSIAAVIYKTITGIDVPEASERAKKDTLVPPGELGIDIHKDTENALMNALEVEAANRTQNCSALYHELYEADKVERRASGGKGKASKKTIAIVTVIAVILVAAVVGVLSQVMKPDPNNVQTEETVAEMPEFLGMTVEEATKKAKKFQKSKGIKIKIVEEEEKIEDSNEDMNGKIATQNPKAGSGIYESDKSTVKVKVRVYSYNPDAQKTGDMKIKVPSVVNEEETQAKKTLENSGFSVSNIQVSYQYSEKVKKGSVISQSVAAGKEIQANSTIVLTVSKGPEPTTTRPPVSNPPKKNPGGNSGGGITKPKPPITTTKPTTTKPKPTQPKKDEIITQGGRDL